MTGATLEFALIRREKFSLAPSGKSVALLRAVSRPIKEGRIAIVTDVGRGMRWTLSARKTNAGREACGEIAWS